MDAFLEGKLALVTGGTRGIGRAIADGLSSAGAKVVVCGRRTTTNADHVKTVSADVSSPQDVTRLFEFVDRELGGLDILINNAGVGVFAPVRELTYEQWRRVIDTNLTGAYLCSHAALSRFNSRGGGFIVNIGSLAGRNPFAGGAAYNASKFGLNGFTEAMMLDHRYDNVRVSQIMPGSVATEFNTGGGSEWKIAAEDIAELVLGILRMPARTLVSHVEVRPSKPKK
jgi:NAD(P)-dependent dehydrogenase (short-subunit alcohol dehydrogenase family)